MKRHPKVKIGGVAAVASSHLFFGGLDKKVPESVITKAEEATQIIDANQQERLKNERVGLGKKYKRSGEY